jgi:hypothetical protein
MTIKSRLLLVGALCMGSSTAALAEDYIIDGAVTVTNGNVSLSIRGDDTMTVTDTGSVSTSGFSEHGLSTNGSYFGALTNNGVISTTGSAAYGMSMRGGDNTLTNNGIIRSNGYGLYVDGNHNNTLINNNTVETFGNNNSGLFANTDGNTLINRGDVSTTGTWGYGMEVTGLLNNTLINSGTITTTAAVTHGMRALGDYNTLTNSGDINISGGSAHGMYGRDDFNTLTNSGTITVEGGSGHGMYVDGDNNMLTNIGDINVAGGSGDGLTTGPSAAHYNTFINRGRIIVNEFGGTSAHGIKAVGDFNTSINSGSITVYGQSGHGLYADGASPTITNSGNIIVHGDDGNGLNANGDSSVLTNSGNIIVHGDRGHGLYANGDSNTITNSGTVLSDDGYSVHLTSSDATLNLLSGSVLSGKVYFSDFNTATLNFGSGLNAAVTLSSAMLPSGFTITAPGAYTVVGDTVYVTDLGDYAAQDQASGIASRLVHDAVATRGVVPAVTQGSAQSDTWASVTGSLVRNSGDATLTGYDGTVVSGSFGRDRLDGPGVFAGVSLSQTETDSGVNNDAIGVHGGIYGQLGGADYTLIVGLSYNDTARQQANNTLPGGLETASDSYLSLFVSPAMTWNGLLGGNDSLRLAYTGSYYGSHSFDFSAGDLAIDSRFTHQLEARVAWARVIEAGTVRYGLDLGYQSGDAISLTLAGQSLSASTPGDEAYGRVFAGMDFSNGTVEASYDNNNEVSLTASYSWRF